MQKMLIVGTYSSMHLSACNVLLINACLAGKYKNMSLQYASFAS